ncbi:MAG: carboxypeptidase-like regulatory domain-containing protein [Patescibacteria group bacterium]
MIKKLFLSPGLLMVLITIWQLMSVTGRVSANNDLVFTYPEKNLTVFEVDTETVLKGYAKYPRDKIKNVAITFDGQIWRDVVSNKGENSDYYYWHYPWTVAGQGRSFVLVRANLVDGTEVETRILIEVYVPPEKEEKENVYELLDKIREENRLNSQAQNTVATNLGVFGLFEYISEDYIGNFITEEWPVFLPTIYQQQFMIDTLWQINIFIKKYPAGIDIFSLLTAPYLLTLSLAIILIFISSRYMISDFFAYYWYRLTHQRKKGRARCAGYLVDIGAKENVPWAKIIISNGQNKYIIFSDANGYFEIEAQVPDGEYSYLIQKPGYKEYIIDKFDLTSWRSHPVIQEQILIGQNGYDFIILAVERLVDKKRAIKAMKAEYTYIIKKWFWQNINPLFAIGFLFGSLWRLFTSNNLINYYLVLLILAYLVYRKIIRIKHKWGRVVDRYGKNVDYLELELWKNGELLAATWTDWKGRYSFGRVNVGDYQIKVAGATDGKIVHIDQSVVGGDKPIYLVLD